MKVPAGRAVLYDPLTVTPTNYECDVVDLVTPTNNCTAQLSIIEDGDGYLIRVWPPNGTFSNGGGSNVTAFSMVVRFDEEGIMRPEMMRYTPDACVYNHQDAPHE